MVQSRLREGGRAHRTCSRATTASKELPARPDSRSLIRVLNVSLLIELVRRSGPVSRADLARQSQISAPTVSGIVRDLLNRGIFSEVALAPSSGGRPPILLELEPKAGYVVGIKLPRRRSDDGRVRPRRPGCRDHRDDRGAGRTTDGGDRGRCAGDPAKRWARRASPARRCSASASASRVSLTRASECAR